jgi:hypothetical protein
MGTKVSLSVKVRWTLHQTNENSVELLDDPEIDAVYNPVRDYFDLRISLLIVPQICSYLTAFITSGR